MVRVKRLCWTCHKCEHMWETFRGMAVPECCPICGFRSVRGVLPEVFDEWKQIQKTSRVYKEMFEDPIWSYCVKVWEAYR